MWIIICVILVIKYGDLYQIPVICSVALKHARLPMLAKQIELAPKNGDFVVLQDGWSGSWEVGRWAPESGSWVRIDGKPLRIFPTHWVPVSGDTVGSENTEGLSFLAPAIQMTEPRNDLGIVLSWLSRSQRSSLVGSSLSILASQGLDPRASIKPSFRWPS